MKTTLDKKDFETIDEAREIEEEKKHQQDCKEGRHHFVACDEWEPTCIYCGKFQ